MNYLFWSRGQHDEEFLGEMLEGPAKRFQSRLSPIDKVPQMATATGLYIMRESLKRKSGEMLIPERYIQEKKVYKVIFIFDCNISFT